MHTLTLKGQAYVTVGLPYPKDATGQVIVRPGGPGHGLDMLVDVEKDADLEAVREAIRKAEADAPVVDVIHATLNTWMREFLVPAVWVAHVIAREGHDIATRDDLLVAAAEAYTTGEVDLWACDAETGLEGLRALCRGEVSIHGPGFSVYAETLEENGLTLEAFAAHLKALTAREVCELVTLAWTVGED